MRTVVASCVQNTQYWPSVSSAGRRSAKGSATGRCEKIKEEGACEREEEAMLAVGMAGDAGEGGKPEEESAVGMEGRLQGDSEMKIGVVSFHGSGPGIYAASD